MNLASLGVARTVEDVVESRSGLADMARLLETTAPGSAAARSTKYVAQILDALDEAIPSITEIWAIAQRVHDERATQASLFDAIERYGSDIAVALGERAGLGDSDALTRVAALEKRFDRLVEVNNLWDGS